MKNERAIQDPKLQKALEQVHEIFHRYGFAGAVMLVSPEEAAFGYHLDAPWSALRPAPGMPLGFRFRARSKEDGAALTHSRVGGAVHTICQLSDFGEQTTAWMEDLKIILRRAGVDFHHEPFNGQPLPHIGVGET